MPTYKGVEAQWVNYNDNYKPYPDYTHEMAGDDIGAYFTFPSSTTQTIEVKLGVSYVSIENARLNLDLEQPGFDFEATRSSARDAWNKLLKRIEVKGELPMIKLYFTLPYIMCYFTQTSYKISMVITRRWEVMRYSIAQVEIDIPSSLCGILIEMYTLSYP